MGIKPDNVCLENACRFKNNIQTLRFLIEKGNLKPTLQCLYNCSAANYNKTLSFITEEYIEGVTSKKELDNIKKNQRPLAHIDINMSDDENDIKDDNNSIDSTELIDYGDNEQTENIVQNQNEDELSEEEIIVPIKQGKAPRKQTAKKAIRKQPVSKPIEELEEDDSEVDLDEDESEVKNPTKFIGGKAPVKQPGTKTADQLLKELKSEKKTSIKKSTTTVKIESDDDVEIELVEEKKPTKKTTTKKKLQKEETLPKEQKKNLQKEETLPKEIIKTIDTVEIPDDYNYRETKKLPANVISMFSLGKVDSLSFINLRKHVMKYIVDKNLIKDNMLSLDSTLKKLVNDQYTCIDSKYIDKLIFLMINK
jgi:hypothetical protein